MKQKSGKTDKGTSGKTTEAPPKVVPIPLGQLLRDERNSYSALMAELHTHALEVTVSGTASDERKTPDCGVRRTTPRVDEYGRSRGKKRPEGRRSVDLAPDAESDAELLAIQAEEEE